MSLISAPSDPHIDTVGRFLYLAENNLLPQEAVRAGPTTFLPGCHAIFLRDIERHQRGEEVVAWDAIVERIDMFLGAVAPLPRPLHSGEAVLLPNGDIASLVRLVEGKAYCVSEKGLRVDVPVSMIERIWGDNPYQQMWIWRRDPDGWFRSSTVVAILKYLPSLCEPPHFWFPADYRPGERRTEADRVTEVKLGGGVIHGN